MDTRKMKKEILQNLNAFDSGKPWCLPHRFWTRAILFTGYEVYPLGRIVDLPVRRCHMSSMDVMANREGTPLDYCTGYASTTIEDMKYWTRHSWVVHKGDMILLETTPNSFDAYYGVTLTPDELAQLQEILNMVPVSV